MMKLSPETLSGLSGLGDLCVTCLSSHSRNYRFGHLIASDHTPEQARDKIGQVVEGAYTCISAMQISEKFGISVPIIEGIHKILQGELRPQDALDYLTESSVNDELL